MPTVSKNRQVSRSKPVLLIDCFGTISHRHYIWYVPQVYLYKMGLIKNLELISPEVVPILRDLKKDYELVFFSNFYHPWTYAGLKAQKLEDLFDVVVVSSEIKARKPWKKIYLKTLKLLGRKPEECTLVDNAGLNNTTARKLGMKTMSFKDQPDLYRQLAKLVKK